MSNSGMARERLLKGLKGEHLVGFRGDSMEL